jgi:site-specific DNA recombinase
MEHANASRAPRRVRCAIYTRKSSEEGLDQAFNSLDAQREAGEAFILSQRQEGWSALPDRYDDGGFTGGNMERPALRKLMTAIQAGRVDCVVVYKVDRLSRSLLDFARMMGVFDQYGVSFVSVTQQFNTSAPVGRLTLNILLSFAQFEREIISDRTRDKLSAARKKGKWTGGYLLLGYDLDPRRGKLVVNHEEARQVRTTYRLFAKCRHLPATLAEIQRRGWKTKTWLTKKGKRHFGGAFTEASLVRLLTNPIYKGCVYHKGKFYEGEHAAIVNPALWNQVNRLTPQSMPGKTKQQRNKHGALLQGLLHCACCNRPMAHTYSSVRGRRYHYYVCLRRSAQSICHQRVPAPRIEQSVRERIETLSRKPGSGKREWHSWKKEDQLRWITSRIEKVTWDGATGRVQIRLRPGKESHA